MIRFRRVEAAAVSASPRFRRSVVRDLRARMRFALVGLAAIGSLHVAAMIVLEGLSLSDAAWLTFTSITTTGYGDLSAQTLAGRSATVILIYLSGIFLLTQAGSAFFELRTIRRERMRRGEWRWGMSGHVVFVNMPADEPGDYLRRLVDQLRRSFAPPRRPTSAFACRYGSNACRRIIGKFPRRHARHAGRRSGHCAGARAL